MDISLCHLLGQFPLALTWLEREKGVEAWPSFSPIDVAFAALPTVSFSVKSPSAFNSFVPCLASQPILAFPLLNGVCHSLEAQAAR